MVLEKKEDLQLVLALATIAVSLESHTVIKIWVPGNQAN